MGGGHAFFFSESAAEVREALIADFKSGFRDIALAAGDEGGGALDAYTPQPLGKGGAFDLGEGAAEVAGIAADGGG